jgi:hypothetical protein
MSTVYLWSGALTPTGARVVAKVTGTSSRLAVSASPAMTSPTYFGPVVPTNEVVSISATGLSADTVYYCAIEDDSVLDTAKVGKFRTLPTAGTPASFTVVASGCAGASGSPYIHSSGVSNSPIFDTIRTLDPLFFAHLGDRNYANIDDNDQAAFRDVYDRVMAAPRQADLYRNVPTVYAWDDHDYGNNNSDAAELSRPAVSAVYRERVPSYALPAGAGDNAIYHSFEVGRVLFIVSDTRWARVPGATMLGATQKAWMEGVLASSSAEALVWLLPTPWLGLSDDTWAAFTSERDELRDMFATYGWSDRMVCINADYHGLGMDTGGGNLALTGAPFPVWLWCSLDSPGSGTPGGITTQYDQGPTSPGADRYGVLEVDDQGDYIALTGTGYIGSTPWASYTLNIVLESSTAVAPRDLTLTYDDTLSRVRVTSTEVEGAGYAALSDSFDRTESNGWGTPDEAGNAPGPWVTSGAPAANFSVSTGRGRMGLTPVSTRHYVLHPATYADVEYTSSFIVPAAATGGDIAGAFLIRAQDTANYYMAQVLFKPTGVLHLDLYVAVAGTHTAIATGVDLPDTYSGAARVNIRLSAKGSVISAKAWNNLNPEPSPWSLVGSDTTYTSGSIGVSGILFGTNTNTQPVAVSFEDLQTVSPDPITITVARSTNEVTWATVRGGDERTVNSGEVLTVDDYEFSSDVANHYRVQVFDDTGTLAATQTGVITPILGTPWIKSIARPFLNRALTGPVNVSDISRAARSGVFDVVGRSFPVAVTDLRSGRQVTIEVLTDTEDRRRELDLITASGDPIFLHMPAGRVLSSMYAVIGDTLDRQLSPGNARHFFVLPLTEVAAPGPEVIGATSNYQTIANTYATYADLADAHDTYGSLRELVGSPDDIIVG